MMRQVLGRLERSHDEIERVTRDLRQTLYAVPAAVAGGD
jgi:hypothetical protein